MSVKPFLLVPVSIFWIHPFQNVGIKCVLYLWWEIQNDFSDPFTSDSVGRVK